MNQGNTFSTCAVAEPKRDKSDIEIASDRIGEKSENTARLIMTLSERLESVLKPSGTPMPNVVGNAQGIERARSQLDKRLTSHGDFISENNAKLQDLIDSLSV